jgi:hypothetical protein
MTQSIESLDKNFIPAAVEADVAWYDALSIGVEGKAFSDTELPYDRLPARAKGVVIDAVWSLSRYSAGMAVRFVTDSPTISARWSVTSESLAMNHMPATGVSGLDLYGYENGRWYYCGTGRPTTKENNENQIVAGLLPGLREYILYLPLYNGTSSLKIGLKAGSKLLPATSASNTGVGKKPLVFYGTSILHGGCASRTGMAYPAIIARNLGYSHVNLGFSGNGPMHLEMTDFIAEIDASMYIIDSLPNMSEQQVLERTVPFVEKIRAKRPSTPILLVENIVYQGSMLKTLENRGHVKKNLQLRKQFGILVNKGVTGLHYLSGTDLLGHDTLGTVDGTHPTDVGFMRMADSIGAAVREAFLVPQNL